MGQPQMYLEIRNVNKTIDGNEVLKDISYSFECGKIYGLCGKNGCGKTMLMKVICGLNSFQLGEIYIDGQKLGDGNEFPPSVGALIENPGFINQFSGKENLMTLARIRGEASEDRVCDYMKRLGLEPSDKKKYRKYSLGMKQKIGIISAVMEHPSMIILDEPTNALDEDSVEVLNDILLERKNDGALIIIASHDKQELEKVADEIVYIKNGKIINNDDNSSNSDIN